MASRDEGPERRIAAARWLRGARESAGFPTAAQFAEAIGVQRYQLSNWETGRSTVDDDSAERIAVALQLDLISVRSHLGLWVPTSESDDGAPTDPQRVARAEEKIDRAYQLLDEARRELRGDDAAS